MLVTVGEGKNRYSLNVSGTLDVFKNREWNEILAWGGCTALVGRDQSPVAGNPAGCQEGT